MMAHFCNMLCRVKSITGMNLAISNTANLPLFVLQLGECEITQITTVEIIVITAGTLAKTLTVSDFHKLWDVPFLPCRLYSCWCHYAALAHIDEYCGRISTWLLNYNITYNLHISLSHSDSDIQTVQNWKDNPWNIFATSHLHSACNWGIQITYVQREWSKENKNTSPFAIRNEECSVHDNIQVKQRSGKWIFETRWQ